MSTTARELLAETGLPLESAFALEPMLSAIRDLEPESPPPPSPELAALLAAPAGQQRPHGDRSLPRRVAYISAAAALGSLTLTGVAAAANGLPAPAQRLVSELSERYLPITFPAPAPEVTLEERPQRPEEPVPAGPVSPDDPGDTVLEPTVAPAPSEPRPREQERPSDVSTPEPSLPVEPTPSVPESPGTGEPSPTGTPSGEPSGSGEPSPSGDPSPTAEPTTPGRTVGDPTPSPSPSGSTSPSATQAPSAEGSLAPPG